MFIMGRRGSSKAIFRVYFTCILFLPFFAHAETDYKLIKGEVTGINEKTIQIDTEETLKPGEKISLVRDGKTTVVCEVVKIQGNSVIAEILEQIGEPDFDDTIMKAVDVKPPAEEKPKEPTPKVKPEETKPEEKKEAVTSEPKNVDEALSNISPPQFPKPVGYLNDFADVVDSNKKQEIEGLLTSIEKKATAEVAIVTVPKCAPMDSYTYRTELFKEWGIGKKGKDNGLLLLLCLDEKRVEIEVGYGLENVITESIAREVLDNYITPDFKQGNFGEGFLRGAQVIASKILGNGNDEQGSYGVNEYLFKLGIDNFKNGQYKDAKEYLVQFINENPESSNIAEARWYVGRCNLELKQYENALNNFKIAVALKPHESKYKESLSYAASTTKNNITKTSPVTEKTTKKKIQAPGYLEKDMVQACFKYRKAVQKYNAIEQKIKLSTSYGDAQKWANTLREHVSYVLLPVTREWEQAVKDYLSTHNGWNLKEVAMKYGFSDIFPQLFY